MHAESNIQILKENQGSTVWVEQGDDGRACTIKAWSLSPWFALKCLLGISQPWRHWRGGRRLRRQNLASPEVLSVGLGWRGAWPVLKIRMPFIIGSTAAEQISESPSSVGHDIAARLGEAVSILAHAGLRHRDLKLSNIVLQRDSNEIWFIDPVGVMRDRNLVASIVCMLDRLEVEIRDGLVPRPTGATVVVLRSSIRGLGREDRRAVLQQLRTHHSH